MPSHSLVGTIKAAEHHEAAKTAIMAFQVPLVHSLTHARHSGDLGASGPTQDDRPEFQGILLAADK